MHRLKPSFCCLLGPFEGGGATFRPFLAASFSAYLGLVSEIVRFVFALWGWKAKLPARIVAWGSQMQTFYGP
jgi:hypothetical protein